MLVKLLDYNSKAKTAVIEVHGIDSDKIIDFVMNVQKLDENKEKRYLKVETDPHETLNSPDLSILERSSLHTKTTYDHNNASNTNEEDEIDLKKIKEILRDEVEDE